ncbi:MAG: peptidyl-prolyl cis-trans isomerase [Acidobacteriota bacterium]
MTMLDRMRRHKNWLKWSLLLVVIAFVIFYIPDFLGGPSGTAPTDELARIEGRRVTVREFQRAYQAQVQAYRQAYGSNISEQLLKQLGFEQQILQQLVDQQAALAESERLGIGATDEEVGQRILTMPEFQENGQFIGEQRYRQMLSMARPPLSTSEFEASVRRQLVIDKLRAIVTDWITVTDAEADAEYRRRNEKVKVELVHVSSDTFRSEVKPTDADLAVYFEAHKEDYRIGERRRIRYLLIDVEAMRKGITVSTRDVERYYNDNIETWTTPEQVRASHILFMTEGKDEQTVRTAAEQVLAEARAGADFAELAKRSSEDKANAPIGGDLDYFGRGRMAPEFEEAAFSLEPGAISGLVRTQFGYHIIKVTDRRPGSVQSLEQVRPQIVDQLTSERADRQASLVATGLASEIKNAADLEKVAAARGWKVEETGYFTREEPLLALGASPQVTNELFDLADGEPSGAFRVARGYAYAVVTGRLEPSLPTLEDVKDRVRDDVAKEKASALAQQRAQSLAATLKTAADFAAAAKKAGVEAKTSELVARGTALPDVGLNAEVESAVFSMKVGELSDPIVTLDGTTIVKVLERQDVTPEQLQVSREAVKQDLLLQRRNQFMAAYMTKAKQRMRIELNQEALQQLLGG